MLIGYRRGQTSIILRVKILDSAVATGAGKTGLTNASTGLIISTIADTEATATAYTVAAGNVETVTTLGTFAAPTGGKARFREVDATNHKGIYEVQIADARFAVTNAKSLLISISGVTGAAECDVVIPLRDLDPYNALVTANVTQISGDAAAADALESYTDGTAFMPVDAHKPNFAVSGSTLTVKQPDGTTTAYTKTVTTDAAADPITGAS